MPAKGEIKLGFYLGLGVVLAFMVVGFLQLLTIRAIGKGRSYG